jgi:hypothetical protein
MEIGAVHFGLGGAMSREDRSASPTQMLNNYLGFGGQNGGLNPLYQIGGPRSIQLVLQLHSKKREGRAAFGCADSSA